jgi:hypothetical protein
VHHVADRVPGIDIEQKVGRPPQLDAAKLNRELEGRRS